MNREVNHLKDSSVRAGSNLQNMSFSLSYTKTNKLVTALYMVTDIIDTTEPIRTKLRFLGAEILTDINSLHYSKRTDLALSITKRITEIISFLDIAHALQMITIMNSNILKKEFIELKRALENGKNNSLWLEDFLIKDEINNADTYNTINSNKPVRIGVQNGSNLMKALQNIKMSDRNNVSDRMSFMSDKSPKGQNPMSTKKADTDMMKKERRFEIVNIIKNNNNVATIADIRNNVKGVLKDCGEKTLQRELMAMVADGVLKKEGEKRWSKYLL